MLGEFFRRRIDFMFTRVSGVYLYCEYYGLSHDYSIASVSIDQILNDSTFIIYVRNYMHICDSTRESRLIVVARRFATHAPHFYCRFRGN
jgi:hypothetical protein